MKRCKACDREFPDQFRFCPIDVTPLNNLNLMVDARPSRDEFRLTVIDSTTLPARLMRELRFVAVQLRRAWPDLRSDPIGFCRLMIVRGRLRLRRKLAAPNSLAAVLTALFLVFSAIVFVMLIGDRPLENVLVQAVDNDRDLASMIEFLPDPKVPPEGHGIGAGSTEGRVGLHGGTGEGSGPVPRKSSGGGSGGLRAPLPAQAGKPPQPSEIPAPIPKFPPVQKQALPVAGIDIDPALWKNLPPAVFGDPRSRSTAPSNGPGTGGGMGTANGTGIGVGSSGPGFGPGQEGNIGDNQKGPGCCGPGGSQGNNFDDPNRTYPQQLVTERARVLAKPEPQYTEEARRNAITGSVVLRVVFSRTGEVTDIRALQSLPFGLTEKAIAAARQIRFRPATRDGRPVNVYMQLEYNFNLY